MKTLFTLLSVFIATLSFAQSTNSNGNGGLDVSPHQCQTPSYFPAPGDTIYLTFPDSSSSTQSTVPTSGDLYIPLQNPHVKAIQLPNQSLHSLSNSIHQSLTRFTQSPHFSLHIIPNPHPSIQQSAIISGAANTPIFLHHHANSNIAQAVLASSPSRFANLNNVQISRISPSGFTNFTLNVHRIATLNLSNDTPIFPGDIIHIPTSLNPIYRPYHDK